MALSSTDLAELVVSTRKPVLRGKIIYHRDQATKLHDPKSRAQALLFRQLLEQSDTPVPRMVSHPGQHPAANLGPAKRDLTASDIAWLQRLPTDPKLITYDDACQLALLRTVVTQGTGDFRLVQASWGPVKAHYDHLIAETRLANARAPMPTTPPAAAAALAATIAAEEPTLTADEAANRAHALLRETKVRAQRNLDRDVMRAQDSLTRLRERGSAPDTDDED